MHSHEENRLDDIGSASRRALSITLILIVISCAIEAIGGYSSNSLSLCSDAAHLFLDIGSIGLALVLSYLVAYGVSNRVELYGAMINGITLFITAGIIGYEAIVRFGNPVVVHSLIMIVISACCGFLDSLSLFFLSRYRHNQGVEAVYQHLVSDLFSSVGVVIASCIIYLTDYVLIDSVAGCFIAIIILVNSIRLIASTFSKLRR